MGKCVSVHSSRGGTGKTVLATNLAVILARKGFNIAILDLDFRAPSLSGVFSKGLKTPVDCWLNDFLDGRCPSDLAVVDVSETYGLQGKLYVGQANPGVSAIRSMMEKSRGWEVSAVKKLFGLRDRIFDDYSVDWCFFDTSPGVGYTSANAAVISDLSIIVTTLDSIDLNGVKSILVELFDEFAKKAVILVNKVFPETRTMDCEERNDFICNVETALKRPVLGVVPCYCDVLQTDRSTILALDRPNHPFVLDLESVAENLAGIK
jgi:MinD-like ATPase involved in chromosome partitioning or flagellar assembly